MFLLTFLVTSDKKSYKRNAAQEEKKSSRSVDFANRTAPTSSPLKKHPTQKGVY